MDQIHIGKSEGLVVVARHPKYRANVISQTEGDRVRKQGQRLASLGLTPQLIAAAITSRHGRAVQTAELLLEGLCSPSDDISASIPAIVSPMLEALDEIGDGVVSFKDAAMAIGMQPWEALAEERGATLVAAAGIADRLVRATRALAVWTTAAQHHPGHAIIVSDHNGYDIEPAIELAKAMSGNIRTCSASKLPNPERYVEEAGVVLLWFDVSSGLLVKRPVYLDAD